MDTWSSPPHVLGQVHADAIRVKKLGGILWLALAMVVSTQLWPAGQLGEHRHEPCNFWLSGGAHGYGQLWS